jgi:hypothetical protein
LEGKINEIRDVSSKKLNNLINNINKSTINKSEGFMKEFKLIFEGVDDDISDVNHRLNNLQGRLSALITRINEVRLNFNKMEYSYEACEYKQSHSNYFLEAKKIFKDSTYLIGSKTENSIVAASERLMILEEEVQKILKKIQLNKSSVINSIITGISSFTLRIRRFTKFAKNGINFFKTSSLNFSSNSPISIVGFSVCGLFSEENMKNILEIKELNMKNKQSIEADKKAYESSNIKGSAKDIQTSYEKTITFRFTIKEFDKENDKKYQELISENFALKEIKNPIDPTLIFYLNKSININPERTYMISLCNLSKEFYLDLWCGQVSKFFLNNMRQGIRCNTSGIKFEFNPPMGIESDFNEFNSGILSDLIFSHKE